MLLKLKGIRETLVGEIGNVAEIKESREVAISENAELKKEVERLKYRIQILVKSMEEEEAKNRKAE